MARIIITTDVYHPFVCGVTKIVDIFAYELPRYGYKVSIMVPASIKEAYVYERTDSVDKLYLRSLKPLAFYPEVRAPEMIGAYIAIKRMLNNNISDGDILVHAHTPYLTTTILRIAARRMGKKIPILLTYHTLVDEYMKKRFGPFYGFASFIDSVFMGDLIRRIKAIIVPTNYAKKMLLKHLNPGMKKYRHKFIRIPNPLSRDDYIIPKNNASHYYDCLEDKNYAIWVGRISHEKNIPFLMKLFKLIGYKLVIVGKGPLLNTLKKMAPKNVIMTGFVKNEVLRSLLKDARCFVIASSFDNMPLAVMEAMAQGTPIVSYYKGGHNEYISHRVNGFIYKTVREAKKYIKEIFNSDELYEEMSTNARNTAKMFHPDRIIPEHVKTYEHFLFQ